MAARPAPHRLSIRDARFLSLLAGQQVEHERRVDPVVSLVGLDAELVAIEVEAERAVQVRALPFQLPSALVDRAALAKGFLSFADRQVEAFDFVEDLERACEAPSRRQIRILYVVSA